MGGEVTDLDILCSSQIVHHLLWPRRGQLLYEYLSLY